MAEKAQRKTWPEARRLRTRVKLLESAYRLMTKLGVEATSLQEITDRAGVGAGTFYSYFTSKEDIAAQVLDCLIDSLARRTRAAVATASAHDPLSRIVIAVRSGLHEILTNRIWYWWLKQHPDLVVERTRRGFHALGTTDLRHAAEAGTLRLPDNDVEAAWSMLIWQMVAGARDILDEHRDPSSERAIAISVLQALGVSPEQASHAMKGETPPYPDLPIDFAFRIESPPSED